MVKRLVDFALEQRLLTLVFALALIAYGIYSFRELPVEAFPDPDDVQVQVIAQWPGQAAEDMEVQVTQLLEQTLNSTPQRTSLRSISMFGLSVVTLTFEDGTDDNFARSQVLERMQTLNLPGNASWQLAPLTTSTGEIFRYIIDAPGQKLEDVRAQEDWVIEPALRQVPGVGDINAFGGGIKQYQVFVKPEQLSQHSVTLQQVFTALQNNNSNTGGNVLKAGEQSLVVRGVNALQSVSDIEHVAVTNYNGHPVYVGDVAEVRTGMASRQGIVGFYNASFDDKNRDKLSAGNTGKPGMDDVVEGIVVNRKGTNAAKVIDAVKEKVAYINAHMLPKGMKMVQTYDRTTLVDQTLHTVAHNLIEGSLLILIISLIFTSSWRAAVVICMVIPLSLLSAFIILHLEGVAANLLSFGAVDFGILVDAAVVIVEAIMVKQVLQPEADFSDLVRTTSEGLGRPMLFAKLILIVSLIPIFTFQRVEGRIFKPMAITIAGAILGATLATLTIVPLASAYLLKSKKAQHENRLTVILKAGYGHVLRFALDMKSLTIGTALVLLAASIYVGLHLGTEFLPKLDEGNIWLSVDMPLSVSMDQAKANERKIREILESFPESRMIYTQLGRPDDGTDPKGFNNLEIAVYLPPAGQWTTRGPDGKVVNKDGLITQMTAKLNQIPGLDFNFSQYIEDNVEEALSGVKGELAIKLFGDNLKVLQEQGDKIEKVIAGVPGVADVGVEELSGQPNLTITPYRDQIARYGLDGQTVLNLVQTGLGGQAAGTLVEGQKRFDVSVRLSEQSRDAVEHIANLWVDTPTGQRIPLASLASIKQEEGAARIGRDDNSRRIAIKCGVRGRDMGSFVQECQRQVAEKVPLPPGYRVTWEGQFENQKRATARLQVIVPLSLLGVLGLLFFAFRRLRYAALIMLNIPFVLIGAVALLYLTHTNLSVSAMIGFIALSGVSVLNGTVLVGQFNQLRHRGLSLYDAVLEGSKTRLRPVLMSALMAAIGMYPAATSHGIGSEVQRPLALVVLGGMMSAVVLTLIVLPVLYVVIEATFPAEVTVPEGLVE
jgi:cobalt-zinc-cadmium resistance protein CzcA